MLNFSVLSQPLVAAAVQTRRLVAAMCRIVCLGLLLLLLQRPQNKFLVSCRGSFQNLQQLPCLFLYGITPAITPTNPRRSQSVVVTIPLWDQSRLPQRSSKNPWKPGAIIGDAHPRSWLLVKTEKKLKWKNERQISSRKWRMKPGPPRTHHPLISWTEHFTFSPFQCS